MLTKLAVSVLQTFAPTKLEPVVIQCTPPQALEHLIEFTDKMFGKAWDARPHPGDSIETIMFRSGAASYREQIEKALHATSKKATPR